MNFRFFSGGFDPNAIGKLIAIGFLLMTPEAANMVKKFVSGPGGGGGAGFGAGIGAGLAAGAAPVGAAARAGGRAAYERSPIGQTFARGAQMRGEITQMQARRNIAQKKSAADLLRYGVGYPDDKQQT